MPIRTLAFAFAIGGLLWTLASSAWAVGAVGTPVRVDQDPNTPVYKLGSVFNVARGPASGFAVAWEEDRNTVAGVDAVRFRVFRSTGAAVALPGSANVAGRIEPALSRITPLGTDSLYLVYLASLPPPATGVKGKREIFGQRVLAATGAISTRAALNATQNNGTVTSRPATLRDGRVVATWFDDVKYSPIPGRFVSPTGVLQPVNIDLACCQGGQLTGLEPLGTGLLASYLRLSPNNQREVYGRVYKDDGKPLGAEFKLPAGDDPIPGVRALSNGSILFFRSVPVGSKRSLVGRLYSQTWTPGGQRTIIADQTSTTGFVFAATLDGGFLLVRTEKAGTKHSYVIQRYSASLVPVGTSFAIAAEGPETPRIAVLSSNRAVVAFRKTVSNRSRLYAQLLSY